MKVLLVLVLLLLVACDGSNVPVETPTSVPAQPVATNTVLPRLLIMSPLPQTQPSVSEFTLLGSNIFRRSLDTFVSTSVVGVYRYNGENYLKIHDINATISAANGTVSATEQAYVRPFLVAPGSLLPFNVLFSSLLSDVPDNYDNLEITISAEEASSDWLSANSTEFEVTNTNMVPANGSEPLRVLGTVTNKSGKNASWIDILAVLYDEQGSVVDVESTIVAGMEFPYDEQGNIDIDRPLPLDQPELAPGASEPFSIQSYWAGQATKFEIVVSGEIR